MLSSMVKDNIDILMVSETKLDSSFPQAQFRIEGYAPPFRYDRNSHGGGILLFIREEFPTKIISITPLKDFKGILVELHFRQKKILLCCSCDPHKNLKSFEYSRKNIGYANENIRQFPYFIRQIYDNFPNFHKLTLTVLKIRYKKQKPLVVMYRDYKHFSNENFQIELLSAMERYSNISFAGSHSKFLYFLGKHAPVKKRYIRANQKNFMEKEINQAIMVRSKLRNQFLKLKTEEDRLAYAKQRNYCVKLSQQKKARKL